MLRPQLGSKAFQKLKFGGGKFARCSRASAAVKTTQSTRLDDSPLQKFVYVETKLEEQVRLTENVLIGIDPDNTGAVAFVKLCTSGGSMSTALQKAEVMLRDMPCVSIDVGKRKRRQADVPAVVAILREALQLADGGTRLLCTLEEPVPGPLNGKQSVFGTGFAYGVWNGVLSSHGITPETVSARRWKNELGLNGSGKDGSRALATAVFPQAADLLRRKKDHGRAEAMLILAWALGLRVPKVLPNAAAPRVESLDLGPRSQSSTTDVSACVPTHAPASSLALPSGGQ